jgi:uncharacterized protein YecE (DUF72 family)
VGGALLLGTSGFAYDAWRGTFYPSDIRSRDMLAYYAQRFGSVEINYTFRKHPAGSTVERWRSTAPPGFVFSVKANQQITHWLRLAHAGDAVATFLAEVRPLGSRLGAVLFQCPPTLEFDPHLLESFLDLLPEDVRFAFEFRHPSWDEAHGILASRGVAWCAADTDDDPFSRTALLADPFAYLRLRRTGYTDQELGRWADLIGGALHGGRDVYCYVKHEEEGIGPRLARRLADVLESSGLAPPAEVRE